MDRQSRYRLDPLDWAFVPDGPGTYALYREGLRVYAGEARNLHSRVTADFGRSPSDARRSRLRQAVAERLGLAAAAEVKSGARTLTADEQAHISAWLSGCELVWVEQADLSAARAALRALLAELTPPLNVALISDRPSRQL